MLSANGGVCVVESRHGSMHVDVFKSRLDAVLAMLDNGALGGGGGYADDKHLAAIKEVIANADRVLVKIHAMRASER